MRAVKDKLLSSMVITGALAKKLAKHSLKILVEFLVKLNKASETDVLYFEKLIQKLSTRLKR
jgi:hypothetical protein